VSAVSFRLKLRCAEQSVNNDNTVSCVVVAAVYGNGRVCFRSAVARTHGRVYGNIGLDSLGMMRKPVDKQLEKY